MLSQIRCRVIQITDQTISTISQISTKKNTFKDLEKYQVTSSGKEAIRSSQRFLLHI